MDVNLLSNIDKNHENILKLYKESSYPSHLKKTNVNNFKDAKDNETLMLDMRFREIFWPNEGLTAVNDQPLNNASLPVMVSSHDIAEDSKLDTEWNEILSWKLIPFEPVKLKEFTELAKKVAMMVRNPLRLNGKTFIYASLLLSPFPADDTVPVNIRLDEDNSIDLVLPLTASVEGILLHALVNSPHSNVLPALDRCFLKVRGLRMVLPLGAALNELRYVQKMVRLNRKLELELLILDAAPEMKALMKSFDDDLIRPPNEKQEHRIKVGVIVDEILKLLKNYGDLKNLRDILVLTRNIIQLIKNLISFFGFQTRGLNSSIENLNVIASQCQRLCEKKNVCKEYVNSMRYSCKSALITTVYELSDFINATFNSFVIAYKSIFGKDKKESALPVVYLSEIRETFRVHVDSVYYVNFCQSTDRYHLTLTLYYNNKPFSSVLKTAQRVFTMSTLPLHIEFNETLTFKDVNACILPRETVLLFKFYRTFQTGESSASIAEELISWAAFGLFNELLEFSDGDWFLGMYSSAHYLVYTGSRWNIFDSDCPVLHFVPTICSDDCIVKFPDVSPRPDILLFDFDSLDEPTQIKIRKILRKSDFTELTEKEAQLLWERRNYLTEFSCALPKVLSSIQNWDCLSLHDTYRLIREWRQLAPLDSIELLLPCFSDEYVRSLAVQSLKTIPPDVLELFIPQLLRAWAFDFNISSSLAELLLYSAATSLLFAHSLFWELKQLITSDDTAASRYVLLAEAMTFILSPDVLKEFKNETHLMNEIDEIAQKVKTNKSLLYSEIDALSNELAKNEVSLPLNFAYKTNGLQISETKVFNSFRAPIKLVFKNVDGPFYPFCAIYKLGDDITQDMVVLQLISVMDRIWQFGGLDLRLLLFKCLQTGDKRGFIEMVSDSETLREIHVRYGLTGSFKNQAIDQWLIKNNQTDEDYKAAVQNFTLSCAAYCVATFILGVGDRHNDNIMLRRTGHLFHIDFGKYLGDAQKFVGFKRDRTAFVFTSDMAYVIYEKNHSNVRYQEFVDLCCCAFNLIRHHSNILITLLVMLQDLGVANITTDGINFVKSVLKPEESDEESSARFTCFLSKSLQSRWTQVNFFIHNLAQYKPGDEGDLDELSFIPNKHTISSDGRILSVEVTNFVKDYNEGTKRYVFQIQVTRAKPFESSTIFRTYPEFYTFYAKLRRKFPLVPFLNMSPKSRITREQVKATAKRRIIEMAKFFSSLFKFSAEVKDDVLVYTFFHKTQRDVAYFAQYCSDHVATKRDSSDSPTNQSSLSPLTLKHISGLLQNRDFLKPQIKLSLSYENGTLYVLVMHARNLQTSTSSIPSTYVELFLFPLSDIDKSKRRTRHVNNSAHPTYHELFFYRLSRAQISGKNLCIHIYGCDSHPSSLLFFGEINLNEIDLSGQSTIKWFQLQVSNSIKVSNSSSL